MDYILRTLHRILDYNRIVLVVSIRVSSTLLYMCFLKLGLHNSIHHKFVGYLHCSSYLAVRYVKVKLVLDQEHLEVYAVPMACSLEILRMRATHEQ